MARTSCAGGTATSLQRKAKPLVRIGACGCVGGESHRTDEPTVPAADAVRPISCESSSGTT